MFVVSVCDPKAKHTGRLICASKMCVCGGRTKSEEEKKRSQKKFLFLLKLSELSHRFVRVLVLEAQIVLKMFFIRPRIHARCSYKSVLIKKACNL